MLRLNSRPKRLSLKMKVDKEKFEAVLNNLLKTAPIKRSEAKTGQPKTGKIIAAKPQK
jgi:hypothetical protein